MEEMTLSDETVQISVSGAFDAKIATADIVQGFIVHHKGDIGMLHHGMSA